jgi:DNA-binding transcriptional LysR family regulator
MLITSQIGTAGANLSTQSSHTMHATRQRGAEESGDSESSMNEDITKTFSRVLFPLRTFRSHNATHPLIFLLVQLVGAVMNLLAVEAFVRAAGEKSFSKAARQMGRSVAGISKAVSRLEADVGLSLFSRAKRTLSLTPEGEQFLEQCMAILTQLKSLEDRMKDAGRRRAGVLRIAAPVTFGRMFVLPVVYKYQQQHPDVSVEASLSDDIHDLAQAGFDIGFRIGNSPFDSTMVSRELRRVDWVACAAPSYLNSRGRPRTPDELSGHECIAYMSPSDYVHQDWHFKSGRTTWRGHIGPSAAHSIDFCDALVDLALAGAGIIYVHDYAVGPHLHSKSLERVLTNYATPAGQAAIVYPRLEKLPEKIASFLDFAVGALSAAMTGLATGLPSTD